jgi:hypothetical protein
MFFLQIAGKHKLGNLSVTTYDFRTAMKRVGPSIGVKKGRVL